MTHTSSATAPPLLENDMVHEFPCWSSATPRYVSMGELTDGKTDNPSVTVSAVASWLRVKPPVTTSETATPFHVVSLSRAVKTPSMVVENAEQPESLVAREGRYVGGTDCPTPWKAFPSKNTL